MKSLHNKDGQTDPLEQFIADNRREFDDDAPRASIWEAIERDLPTIERRLEHNYDSIRSTTPRVKKEGVIRQLYPYWKKAAVACMLITIGLLGGMLLADERGSQGSGDVVSNSNRVEELEQFYQREIDRRLQLVASYKPEPELRRELASMTQPDFREEGELVATSPSHERAMIEAMAQEYKAKLEALEHVLEQLHAAEVAQPKFNEPGPRQLEEL